MIKQYFIPILLCAIILSASSISATEYKYINGKIVPVNPLDQSDDIFEIDNESIVQALTAYQNDIRFLKRKLKKMDQQIASIKKTNASFNERIEKFIIMYNRRF